VITVASTGFDFLWWWNRRGYVFSYLSANTPLVLSEYQVVFCSRDLLYKYHQTVLDTFLSVSSVNINQSN